MTVRVHSSGVNQLDHKLCIGQLSLVMRSPSPTRPAWTWLARRRRRPPPPCSRSSPPIATQTALTGLDAAGFRSGQKLLVVGGSGGVGSMAIQIAKVLGASYVASVNSQRNAEYVKGLGADEVITYTAEGWERGLHQDYDVVLDCVGGRVQWEQAQRVMKPGGSFVTLIGDDASLDRLTVTGIAAQLWQIGTRKVSGVWTRRFYTLHRTVRNWRHLERVTPWVEEGRVRLEVERVYGFSEGEVVQAYETSAKGRTRGKLVVDVIKA